MHSCENSFVRHPTMDISSSFKSHKLVKDVCVKLVDHHRVCPVPVGTHSMYVLQRKQNTYGESKLVNFQAI